MVAELRVMRIVCPTIGCILDLQVEDRRVGAAVEQPIDHFSLIVQGSIVKWRPGKVKTGRNGIYLGAPSQQLARRFLLPPSGCIYERVVNNLPAVTSNVGGNRRAKGPRYLASFLVQSVIAIETSLYALDVTECRILAQIVDRGASLKK
jgi:hypothetical protein